MLRGFSIVGFITLNKKTPNIPMAEKTLGTETEIFETEEIRPTNLPEGTGEKNQSTVPQTSPNRNL